MNALHFDTLKFARKLKAAGLSEEAAEAIAGGVGEFDTSELATKQDMAELRAATKQDMAELRAATKQDIGELRVATKQDIFAVKQDISELKAELFRHLWIMSASIVGVTVTLIKVLP